MFEFTLKDIFDSLRRALNNEMIDGDAEIIDGYRQSVIHPEIHLSEEQLMLLEECEKRNIYGPSAYIPSYVQRMKELELIHTETEYFVGDPRMMYLPVSESDSVTFFHILPRGLLVLLDNRNLEK